METIDSALGSAPSLQCKLACGAVADRDLLHGGTDRDETDGTNADNGNHKEEEEEEKEDDGDGDNDCLLFYDDTQDDGLDEEAHETLCRRAYVAVHGPGVPVFLMGARGRAGKGWSWLLAASSGDPARGQAAVGRVNYGPYRFYVGDVDARGLPDGYGAVVHVRADAAARATNAEYEENARVMDEASFRWPEPHALLKWHEGFWRAGQRQGEGVNVCLEYRVAMQGCWREDLFDGHGVRVYGRGRWTLLPDGSGNGRWSGGDIWRYCGHWRGGERHGTGVLTVAGHAQPFTGIWLNGTATSNDPEPVYSGAPPHHPQAYAATKPN
nr:morn repeat [Pandoravirus massiliensis]